MDKKELEELISQWIHRRDLTLELFEHGDLVRAQVWNGDKSKRIWTSCLAEPAEVYIEISDFMAGWIASRVALGYLP